MSAAQTGSDNGPGAAAPGQDDPSALLADINRTRAKLGDTVEALVAKVDVKARAQQRAAEVSTQAKAKLHALPARQAAAAAAAAVAVASAVLTGWLALRRRR